MVNRVLLDYVREVRKRLRHLPGPVQRDVVAELVAHIEDQVASQQKATPGLAKAEAAANVIAAFCPAEDLAVAVGPRGGIIQASTGALLLPVTVLSDKGLGRRVQFLRAWTAVAAAGSVALVAVIAFTVFTAITPESLGMDAAELDGAWPPLIDRHFSGVTGFENTTFQVPAASTFQLTLQAEGTGCLGARLYDPSGVLVMDAWDQGPDCQGLDQSVASDQPGTWRLELRYEDYDGSLQVTGAGAAAN